MDNKYNFGAACVYFMINDFILSDSEFIKVKNVELYEGLTNRENKQKQLSKIAKVKSVSLLFPSFTDTLNAE